MLSRCAKETSTKSCGRRSGCVSVNDSKGRAAHSLGLGLWRYAVEHFVRAVARGKLRSLLNVVVKSLGPTSGSLFVN